MVPVHVHVAHHCRAHGAIDVAEIDISYATTVGAFQSASPPSPTVSTTVLGAGLPGLPALVGPVVTALVSGTGEEVAGTFDTALFGPGALVPRAAAEIQAATGPGEDTTAAALSPLAGVLSLTVNVRPDQPGAPAGSATAGSSAPSEYKVSALRIAAAGGTGEIYLATSSAGPVTFRSAGAG